MFIKLGPAGHADVMSQLRAEGAGIMAAAETLGTATTQTGAEWTGDAATASAVRVATWMAQLSAVDASLATVIVDGEASAARPAAANDLAGGIW